MARLSLKNIIMKTILLPATYQEDSPETRIENQFKINYEKMYSHEYVQSLVDQITDLTDCLHGAIQDSKNRGTQRMCIPVIRRSHGMLEEWKKL